MFFACVIWCLADISSVSPSSEQTLCSDERLTLETSAKHHIPQAKNVPYLPLLIKPIFSALSHAEIFFFESSLPMLNYVWQKRQCRRVVCCFSFRNEFITVPIEIKRHFLSPQIINMWPYSLTTLLVIFSQICERPRRGTVTSHRIFRTLVL